jgi:hypothetical protein
MIPYMDLNEQVDADFTRARRTARLRAVMARVRRGQASNRLLPFDEVRKEFMANNRLHRGTRVVGVEEIVGSVGRWDEFDRSFLPVRASMAERWKRIVRAFHRAEDLPPVKLYKLKGTYFVVDSHHRVSVARYQDVPTLEAAVVAVRDLRSAATTRAGSGGGGGSWRCKTIRKSRTSWSGWDEGLPGRRAGSEKLRGGERNPSPARLFEVRGWNHGPEDPQATAACRGARTTDAFLK